MKVLPVEEMVGGHHWRVVRRLVPPLDPIPVWVVYRRRWDRWEPGARGFATQHEAMTLAHSLASHRG